MSRVDSVVWLVIQQGVYRHDIRGVYSTQELAIRAAKKAAREDRDSYHEYIVHEALLDQYVADTRETEPTYRKDRQ